MRRLALLAVFAMFAAVCAAQAFAADTPVLLPYQDWTLPVETRVADLVSRMTIEEKAVLLSSGAKEIKRLGIKPYHVGSEALHGVMGPGNFTVFPQAVALASTWDPDFIMKVTTAISDEAWGGINRESAKNGYPGERWQSFWSPTINMARDPRWGRTPETYGEDPYLTSRIGIGFVKGLQGNDGKYIKTVSTPKHYAANNEEHNRFLCNAKMSDRTLREYYLPAFKALIQEGGAQSVMAAYNAVNGVPCNANAYLLTDILRDEWQFDGFVTTDCDALKHMIDRHHYTKDEVETAAKAINAGVDIECGGDNIMPRNIVDAFNKGMVSDATIDLAVTRILRVRMRLGMFDPPEIIPFTRISPDVIGSKEHMELARETSRLSMVLMKNTPVSGKPLLPIDLKKYKKIVIVGPNAFEAKQFGDYTGTPVNPPVSPLNGLTNRIGAAAKVTYIPWIPEPIDSEYSTITGKNIKAGGASGIRAQYFAGEAFGGKPILDRAENEINLNASTLPAEAKSAGKISVRWTGKLTSEQSGVHYLYAAVNGEIKIYLDGKLVHEKATKKKKQQVKPGAALSSYAMDVQGERRKGALVMLKAGRSYDITVEYVPTKGETVARLDWSAPKGENIKARAAEMEAIADSDLVIGVMGLVRAQEHENIDRFDIELPYDQTEYAKCLMALNGNVALVFINGSPLGMEWIKNNVPAILEAWYPGEQGGNAIADVLFGDFNPAGRLPYTVYRNLDDLPDFNDYDISKGRTYMYFEGQPLFPFGHGLSYTNFEYSNLRFDSRDVKADGFVNVSVDVKNTGERDGEEVVQAYVRDVEASVMVPKKQLRAFERVAFKKGESKTVSFRISVADLGFWDEKAHAFVVEPGEFEVQVGASSADIRQKASIYVNR